MSDPALEARRLLAEYDKAYSIEELPPVPVEEIAESLLLLNVAESDDLCTVDGAPQDAGPLSGLLTTADQTIWVDAREAMISVERRRFTIAHEIAHWVLHARRGDDSTFERFCRPTDLEKRGSSRGIEAEANLFAGELLMPEEIVSTIAADCGFNLPLLAAQFGVSLPALQLRLVKLDLLPAWMRA